MSIEKKDTAWSQGAIIICEKCGKSLAGLQLQEEGPAPENLKRWLKQELRQLGYGKQVRVMTSSCQDICLADQVAITFFRRGSFDAETMTVHPEQDRREVLNLLVKKLGPPKV